MMIVLVLVLGLSVASAIVGALNGKSIRNSRDAQMVPILAQAKTALVSYAMGYIGSGQRPGDLIRPDYFASTESPYNFDGNADSGCMDASQTTGLPLKSSGTNMRCLGRLPWKSLGMSISNPSENDPEGMMPWYAVSANMVDPTCLATLNPDTLNTSYTSYVCAGATLPHPWLTVRDAHGNILSSRVAAVIIIPGPATSGQARPASPNLAAADQYLDSLTVASSCTTPCVPGSYSNADKDNDFIMGEDSSRVSSSDSNYGSPYRFNDRLAYITIDDLMVEVVKRVAGEARSVLNSYKSTYTHFPYAATLGTTTYVADTSTPLRKGMLPLTIPGTASSTTCSGTGSASSYSFTCDFSYIKNVAFEKEDPKWSSKTGSCSFSGGSSKTCTCSGAGSCSTGGTTMTCNASGFCSANTMIKKASYSIAGTGNTASSATGNCGISGTNINCSEVSSASSFVINSNGSTAYTLPWPSWFTDNNWQEFFYYTWTTDSSITAGVRNGIAALLVGVGATITTSPYSAKGSAQSRPSTNTNDYMDSTENTNGDNSYDAVGTSRGSSYNDQMFVVSP